jgi:DHA1 family inner membrane transport protein
MTRAALPFGVWSLAATNFAIGTQNFAFTGTLSGMAADLGVTQAAAGSLVAVSSVTFALVAPLAAGMVMRLERRGLLVATMGALAALNLACMFATDFATLLGLRFVAGIAMGLTGSVASVAAAALVPAEDRGRAFAAVLGGLTAAFILECRWPRP